MSDGDAVEAALMFGLLQTVGAAVNELADVMAGYSSPGQVAHGDQLRAKYRGAPAAVIDQALWEALAPLIGMRSAFGMDLQVALPSAFAAAVRREGLL